MISARDIFAFDLSKYENSKLKVVRVFIHVVLYVAQYLFIFSIVAFFWFAETTVMLSFLVAGQEFNVILLVAMAVVGTIQISAYIAEDLSRDLANMLPFGVLAFIINLTSFDTSESLDVLKQADDNREAVVYYLVVTIALEFALRVLSTVFLRGRSMFSHRSGSRPYSG